MNMEDELFHRFLIRESVISMLPTERVGNVNLLIEMLCTPICRYSAFLTAYNVKTFIFPLRQFKFDLSHYGYNSYATTNYESIAK